MIKEKTLNRWEDITKEFEAPRFAANWLFRGQHDADWELETSLERKTPQDIPLADAEERHLTEFRRRAHFHLESQQIPDPGEDGEWLALMQHFGAPTRLLDVTRSPLVAVYFALERFEKNEKTSHAAVWAINRNWCIEAAGQYVLDNVRGASEAIKKFIPSRYPADMPLARAQGLDSSRMRRNYWRHKSSTIVVPWEPEKLSQRLSIQQGSFLVPRAIDIPFAKNLEAMGETGEQVIRYKIPFSQRGRILERLRLMNITREQLFPGFDGFAQSFQQVLYGETKEERWAREERATMEAYRTEELRAGKKTFAQEFGEAEELRITEHAARIVEKLKDKKGND